MTEINEQLGEPARKVFVDAGFQNAETVKDFYDKDRFIFYSR